MKTFSKLVLAAALALPCISSAYAQEPTSATTSNPPARAVTSPTPMSKEDMKEQRKVQKEQQKDAKEQAKAQKARDKAIHKAANADIMDVPKNQKVLK